MNTIIVSSIMFLILCSQSFAQTGSAVSAEVQSLKPALLVIDIQNEYLPTMDESEKKYALNVINGALWFFHKNNLPVIRVYHSDLRWGPEEGSDAFKYPATVGIKESDVYIHKHYPSAFTKTDLEKILKEKGINTIFLTGLSATMCVLATYFGGVDREYTTYLVREGILSHRAEYTDVVKDICETVSFETMMTMLQRKNEGIPTNK